MGLYVSSYIYVKIYVPVVFSICLSIDGYTHAWNLPEAKYRRFRSACGTACVCACVCVCVTLAAVLALPWHGGDWRCLYNSTLRHADGNVCMSALESSVGRAR